MKKILYLLFILLIFGCEGKPKPKVQERFRAQKREIEKVEVMVLKKRPFFSFISYPGVFKEWDSFSITPELSGKIEYLPYQTNDFIKKGATIVRIATQSLQALPLQSLGGP